MKKIAMILCIASALGLCLSGFATAAPFAYIRAADDYCLAVLDTATNTVSATVHLSGGSGIYGGVAVSPDGSRVYVAPVYGPVSVLDTATNTIIATVPVNNPQAVAVSPDGLRAYVADSLWNWGSVGTVAVIDTATNTVSTTISLNYFDLIGLTGLAVSPDGSRVYVTGFGSGSSGVVFVLDTATNTVSATVTLNGSGNGLAVSPDGSRVYVSCTNFYNSSFVSVISTATNTITSTISVPGGPWGLAVTPDGSRVYVAHANGSTEASIVSVIDTATNTVTATVPVGAWPTGLAVTPDGTIVYVPNYASNTVSVISTATDTVTATVPVPGGPVAIGMFIGPNTVRPTHATGKIVVVNDDWVLSNTGFAAPNDPGKFATNVAAWFTGGRPGKFRAYSDHFGLNGSSLASAMTSAGHTWTTGTAGFTFDLTTLQKYDGIFLLVAPADDEVLIDYVESGGNVYLAYSGDPSHLDEQYNTFVNHFGLGLGVINNGLAGNVAISSPHPIFASVDSLYNVNGSDILDLAPADPGQTVVVSQNGHGLYAVYDGGTSFTQADLAGTWYFQVYEDNVSANAPYWASGTLMVDTAGSITGGTAVNDSEVVRKFTGGSLIIDSTGQVSGTLTASGGITGVLPHGKLDAGKNILTLVDSSNDYRGLFVMTRGGGTFTQADLAGTWYFQVYEDNISANAPYWASGTLMVDTAGSITGGTAVNDSEVVRKFTGGSLIIDSTGQVSGTLTASGGITGVLPHGKLDAGKNILTLVDSSNDYRGLFVMTRGGRTFTQADLAGTWYFQVIADSITANAPYWGSGTMIVNATGAVIGGTAVNSGGETKTLTGGSLTIDSAGQVSGSTILSDGIIESLPYGKLDAGKNILTLVNSDLAYRGLLVAIKGSTFDQAMLTVAKAGNGAGIITSVPSGIDCGPDCSESFAVGTKITLTATADTGSTFTSWTGCDTTSSNSCTVTMTGNKSVSATFTLNQYTLTVTKSGTGSGTVTSSPAGINCGDDCNEIYNYGTVVTLTATPSTGYAFSSWSGSISSTSNPVNLTMDSAKAVTANFIILIPTSDLIITAVTGPTTAIPGASITIGATTKNQGTGTATASTTKFYWSTNNTYSADDIYLGSMAIPALAAGATNTGTIAATVPSACSQTTWYIIARADTDGAVPETNENNNNKAKSVKTGPDLIVSTVTAPTTSGAGLTITVTDTTKNDGGCPAGASNTNLYLSTNSPWDAGDTYLGSRAVPALAAGATNTMGSNVTIPAGTATGTWYIIARADANGVVTETSETNNNKAKSIKIGPDLIVSSITAPLSAVNGSTITIGDTTKNSGGGAAGASTTRLYLSTNTTYDAVDILLRSRAVPALNAGTTNKLSASVTLPSVTPGAYYIIAVSDAGSVVVETNETNNTKYKAITITP